MSASAPRMLHFCLWSRPVIVFLLLVCFRTSLIALLFARVKVGTWRLLACAMLGRDLRYIRPVRWREIIVSLVRWSLVFLFVCGVGGGGCTFPMQKCYTYFVPTLVVSKRQINVFIALNTSRDCTRDMCFPYLLYANRSAKITYSFCNTDHGPLRCHDGIIKNQSTPPLSELSNTHLCGNT